MKSIYSGAKQQLSNCILTTTTARNKAAAAAATTIGSSTATTETTTISKHDIDHERLNGDDDDNDADDAGQHVYLAYSKPPDLIANGHLNGGGGIILVADNDDDDDDDDDDLNSYDDDHSNDCSLTNHDDDDDEDTTYDVTTNRTPTKRNNPKRRKRTNFNNNFIAAATTTTYDTLQKPFKYDKLRGRWSTASDFYFACTSHSFGTIIFSELTLTVLLMGGAYALPFYFLGLLLYAIPIFGIQTFLGQFSSSGAISVFRVAPIFKGIGYSILLHNLASLSYYSVVAAVPLIYAANSLHSVIPWMNCNNSWNSLNCSTHQDYDDENPEVYPHATVEFFRHIIRSTDATTDPLTISWPILCGVLGIWTLTLALLLRKISFIGKFLRCICLLMITFFLAIFINLLIHTQFNWETLKEYMGPPSFAESGGEALKLGIRAAILMPTWLLGPGCGSVLVLSSYNRFRQNSERIMWWIVGTHVLLLAMAMLCTRMALDRFEDHVGVFHYHVEEQHDMQFIYLCFAYLFGSLSSLPNLWSFLFFTILFMAELSAVLIQTITILTTIFDEFEKLRSWKPQVTIALILPLMLISMYFCTKQGFEHLHILPDIAGLTHLTISILLLLITTWIYGRERFQCDLQFMLGKTISYLKIFIMRFVTPVFMVISIYQVIYLLQVESPPSVLIITMQSIIFIIVPLYIFYKISLTNGSWKQRLKQCFSPHDWYPVDADNRRYYEEIMGISEMLVILDSEHQIC